MTKPSPEAAALTDVQLRVTPVSVSVANFPATQPVSATDLDIRNLSNATDSIKAVNIGSSQYHAVNVTIANLGTVSSAVDLVGPADIAYELIALLPDSAWDTASVTFKASFDGTNFFNVYGGDGTEHVLTDVQASRWRSVVDGTNPTFPRYLQIRSGTGVVPVAQVGATVVTLILRAI